MTQSELVKDGDLFPQMPFESSGNGMRGNFRYSELEARLRKIREAIDEESESWITKGSQAYELHDRVASNLHFQFEQCQQYFSNSPNGTTITLEMEKDNPFLWTIVLPHYCKLTLRFILVDQ